MSSSVVMVIAATLSCLFLGIVILALLRQGREQHALSSMLRLLSDQQGQLQRGLSDQLQGQERNLQKNLEERLTDLKQRLAIFDAAQGKLTDLTKEVISLQDILANKNARGAFGEVVLQDLIIDSLPPSLYEFQCVLSNNSKVDCLLRLPHAPGMIAIDAKFPLESYRKLQAEDEAERQKARRDFSKDMRRHIEAISDKYIIAGETADSALLFLPSEAIFAEIHAAFPDILSYSQERRVWLTSPTTLLATLSTVRAILRDVEIERQAGLLQKQVHHLILELGEWQDAFDKFLNRNRMAQDSLEDLGKYTQKIQKRGGQIEALELSDPAPADTKVTAVESVKSLKLLK